MNGGSHKVMTTGTKLVRVNIDFGWLQFSDVTKVRSLKIDAENE